MTPVEIGLLSRHLTEPTGSLLEAVRAYEIEMPEDGFAEVERSLRTTQA